METATKTQQDARATDRVLEALSTLAALLDRTINEVKGLDSTFQERALQAVQEKEASLKREAAQKLEEALAEERTKFEAQLKTKLADIKSDWETERSRLSGEVNRVTQTATQWELERTRLTGEIEKLARVQAATQAEAEKAIAAMRAAAASKSGTASINSEALAKEVERVEVLVKQISDLIENPATELSTVIRKNVERAELESYLKGIRFAVNGAGSK
jgi:hypothetical protein